MAKLELILAVYGLIMTTLITGMLITEWSNKRGRLAPILWNIPILAFFAYLVFAK